jgi:hypothetical protein
VANTSGINNTAYGWQSIFANTTGGGNTGIGKQSLNANTTGIHNTAIGHLSNATNTIGSNNTMIGYAADACCGGLENATAIGAFAEVGDQNTMVLGSINGVNGGTANVKVGIGTTTPYTPLQIDGGSEANVATYTSGVFMIGNVVALNIVMDNNEILARNNGASSPLYLQQDAGFVKIGDVAAPTMLLELALNSAGKPGGGTWTAVSDERLKKDIQPFNDGLDILTQINPVRYKYNETSGIKDTSTFVGIIAQQVKEVAPYMIGQYIKPETGQQYYNYDGSAMTYILVNAVKEQQQQIEEQKKLIEQLQSSHETELSELKAQMAELKSLVMAGMNSN